MVKISVIIPTYNHAQFVSSAIQSVLDQSYQSVEIIVVDDGSTDDTQAVVARFEDRVHYILQENQGLSAARNTGIRVATGEFIGLLDADDIYEPTFLSRLMAVFDSEPNCGAVYSSSQCIDDNGKFLPYIQNRIVPPEELYDTFIFGNFIAVHCALVHKSCYDRVGGFDETLRACEDWDMWLRISQEYRMLGIPDVLVQHRILSASMSSDPIRMLDNRLAVLRKHFEITSDDPTDLEAPLSQAYGWAYLTTAVEYLQQRDIELAYANIAQMCRYAPELLTELSVLYELGCGDQPKGWRGDFETLDIDYNASVLIALLERLYQDPAVTNIRPYRRKTFANAHLALGMLYYSKHQFQPARTALLRAIAANPRHLISRQCMVPLVKSLFKAPPTHRIKQGYQEVTS